VTKEVPLLAPATIELAQRFIVGVPGSRLKIRVLGYDIRIKCSKNG
jgi:hypothetical protein